MATFFGEVVVGSYRFIDDEDEDAMEGEAVIHNLLLYTWRKHALFVTNLTLLRQLFFIKSSGYYISSFMIWKKVIGLQASAIL